MLETNKLVRKLSIGNDKLLPLTDEHIQNIQTILLEMMGDFDTFCQENGLRYFLCSGTALGAVRHGGFIPWDEDVDIAMPREDYDQLAGLFTAQYGDRYLLQNLDSGNGYNLAFTKIRKKGTRYIEIFDTAPEQAGIFVDVYPLENTPDFPLWRWAHGVVSDFLHLCCSCVRAKFYQPVYHTYFDDKAALKTVRFKAFLGTCLSFFSLERWCRLTNRWAACCKNTQSRYVTFPCGRKHYFGEMFPRQALYPLQRVAFAGRQFSMMHDPAAHLTVLYGDYTVIPPKNEQERHAILELDLGESV